MPELPELETIRRAITPHVVGNKICQVYVRTANLRHPLEPSLGIRLAGQLINRVQRRGKYLLLRCQDGTLILHLGMTGNLRVVPGNLAPEKHGHLDLMLENGCCLRFTDPRRFGSILWVDTDPLQHPLLAHMGPEPLKKEFDGDYLWHKSRRRKTSIKQLLMDSRVVAGIGNIYAGEALFRAHICPARAAGKLSTSDCKTLAAAVKETLADAVACGTRTAIKGEMAEKGYFPYRFLVYDRKGLPCPRCGAAIKKMRLGGRSTYCCSACQK